MALWLRAAGRGFESLHNRNFRLFWFGQIISLTGTWMQTTAQAWLVLKLTRDSPFALGLVTTLQFLPVMLLALFGGVLADRLPRRRSLVATQTLLMIQAFIFGLLVALGWIQLWHVYILAAVQGLINALDVPLRQTFIFEMVGREELVNAIGLNSMTFQGSRIVGPSLAGILIGAFGIAPALLLNAASFIPVIWALLLMDASGFHTSRPSQEGSVMARLRAGLSYALHTPAVLGLLIAAAFIGTFGFNFTIVVPLIADNVLKTDASGYGFLNAAVGVGALVATFGTAYARRITVRRLLIAGAAFGLFLVVLPYMPIYWASILLFLVIGLSAITFATAVNSLLQLNTPDELRGRVLSILVLLNQGSTPVGGFFLGAVGEYAGVPVAVALCGLLCLLGIAIAWLYDRRAAHPAGEAA